jgi:predicted regulator of Ras-like GTPase activity (Roadblock/LC7/MglB family)
MNMLKGQTLEIVQEEFANKILQIQGVGGFILVRNNGQLLASKADITIDPQTLAAMMILSSQDCKTLQSTMGFSRYHYLMVTQEKIGKLYVFPIQNHLLGVIHRYPDHDPMFVKKMKQFIHGLDS